MVPFLLLAAANFFLPRLGEIFLDRPVFVPEGDKVIMWGLFVMMFFGAFHAAGAGEHLAFDLLHLWKGKGRRYFEFLATFVAGSFCFLLFYLSCQFYFLVSDPFLYPFWGMSEKVLDLVFPFGFFLLGTRFFIVLFERIRS